MYPMFWHPISLERCSLLDHCGNPGKPESSRYVMYPYSHLSIYQLNIHWSTHSASTSTPIQQSLIHPPIQFPSIYPCNIHLSIHSTSIHPPIQHPCIHPPIQHPFSIPMCTHLTTVQNPSIHLIFICSSSAIQCRLIFPLVLTFNLNLSHSFVQIPSIHTPIHLSAHEDIQWASTKPCSRTDPREASVTLGNPGVVRL